MKKYKSQALAIVLIIVIIGIIVALGLASRTSKNTLRSLDEKKSQDSSEVVNSLIDTSRSITTSEIINNCRTEFSQGQECTISLQNGTYTAKNFTNIPGVSNFPKCNYTNSSDDISKITFKPIYDVDDYTLKKDEVLSFGFTSPTISTTSCTALNFTFAKIGTTPGGISISKIFAKRDAQGEATEYKPYESSDNLNYFLGSLGTGWSSNWTFSNGTWSFPGTQFVKYGYPIDELRIRAVGSDVKLNMSANNCKMEPFFIKVTASGNCGGTSRSSYYYRPLRNGALPLFDFVLYNKNGDLKFTEL